MPNFDFDNSPRTHARVMGDRTYLGRPCPMCGSTERYTLNRGCVSCAKLTSKRQYAQRKRVSS